MKICLVSPYDLSLPGGVNKHVRSLAERLRRLGDEVEVIGPATQPDDNLGPHVTGFRGVVSIHANDSDNRLGILTSPRAVARYVRRGGFDVVHVHEPLSPPVPFYAVWATSAPARVCTFHRYSEHEGFATRTARQILAPHLRSYDVGIAVSQPAEQYAKVAWPRPLSIVPNGVDVDFFAAPPPTPTASGALRLLFVGQWMDRRKGLAVLLDALGRLRAGGVDASLDIIGYSGQRDRTVGRELEGRHPGITVHGVVGEESLRRLMHAADVFVAPGLGCESFGMVLIEAMAAARPVVCSDIEGYRQVASPEGTCLVPPGDPLRLAEILAALARAPERRAAMGERNAVYARQYDWGIIASQVRGLYETAGELASERGAAPRRRSLAFPAAASTVARAPRSDDAGVDAIREV